MNKDADVAGLNERTRYVELLPGLLTGAYLLKVRDENPPGLYVRAQIDPAKVEAPLEWDAAWQLVREHFGIDPAEVRMEQPIHKFEDGTEIRQLWLGPQEEKKEGQQP